MKSPNNTKNRKLIVKKILVLFWIALITSIHSSDYDIDLESFSFLFESKDIMNILLTSLFSVRPVSYGTPFFPHAWHLGHIPERKKNSVRILKYGPRTRLVRAISDGKLVLTNRFETRASLVSLKLMNQVY